MFVINSNHYRQLIGAICLCLLSLGLSGCADQSITHLRLDIEPRAAINTDQNGVPLALMIKIYQLTEQGQKRFAKSSYQQLLTEDAQWFGADLLSQENALLKPQTPFSVDMPLAKQTQAIAIVGLFRQIDNHPDNWRVVITRQQLTADSIETIAINNNRLILQGRKEK